jgi:signal transduction histidine kinase
MRNSRTTIPDLNKLRRLGVWLPAVAIGLLFSLLWAHHLHRPSDILAHLFVVSIITAGAYLFSRYVFRVVQQKEGEIFRRNQELATLNAVGAVVNESVHLDEILTRALDKLLEMTGVEAGEIFLWEEDTEELVLRTFRGLSPEAFQEITRFKRHQGYPGWIMQTGKPIVVHNLHEDPRFLRKHVKEAGFLSFAGVPLRSKGKMVGVMGIAALEPRRLTSEEVELLSSLGNQIGVAIENASLYARLMDMAVIEERQRIAREMHDGLAQELGYLHLKIGELEMGVTSLPTPVLHQELRQLKKIAAEAYEEVRQAIFGLKMVFRGLGLIPALTEYLHAFSEQSSISVELKIIAEEATRLSPPMEIQIIRLIQEALTNVRKHAQAQHVWVTFEMEEGKAKVTVRDDGQGFDPAEVTRAGLASFGLQTMRERAESVGGSLRIESQRGRGTQVHVWLPMEA